MKKSLILSALAATALTACSSIEEPTKEATQVLQNEGVAKEGFSRVTCLDFNGNVVYQNKGKGASNTYSSTGTLSGTINGRKYGVANNAGCMLEEYSFNPETEKGAKLAETLRQQGAYNVVITNGAGVVVDQFKASGMPSASSSGEITMNLNYKGEKLGEISSTGLAVFADKGPSNFKPTVSALGK